MEVIRTIRNLRAEMNVAPGRKATLMLKPHDGWSDALAGRRRLLRAPGRRQQPWSCIGCRRAANPGQSPPPRCADPCELFIPLGASWSTSTRSWRASTRISRPPRPRSQRAEPKLSNEKFVAKAPANLVEAEQ